jgi:steroid 5-alpha reductase family enzyme
MFDLNLYLSALGLMLVLAITGWIVSVIKRNVTLVDSLWSLFILLAGSVYIFHENTLTSRDFLLISLILIWSIRLSLYLTWRNRVGHEDHRYQTIRRNNNPHFWLKSLYIVFGLQVILAWIVSLPLLGAANSTNDLNWLDGIGFALFLLGFTWQTIADWQLSRFKANPQNRGKVLDSGLWCYSRHPNYFGEFCIWWGFYLVALAAGAWWSILGPLLMTLLLLKVSGVALLEKDIGTRRPDYAGYIRRTNAFLPGKPRSEQSS